MITIGANYEGPELEGSPIHQLIRATMQVVADIRGEPDPEKFSAPAVNVVFYVPGSLGDFPDLKQIEAARFSRKERLVLVAVPVPKDIAKAGASVDFVVDALRQAVAIAAEVFARKGVEGFDLAKANAIVEEVKTAVEERREKERRRKMPDRKRAAIVSCRRS